jgi:CRISPR-associated protein Cas2
MLVLITYDVNTETAEGRRRLGRIAKTCTNYGQRVQNSVFECRLDNAQLVYVREMLLGIMNKETDSLRIYNLGNNYTNRIEQYGAKMSYDPGGELIL